MLPCCGVVVSRCDAHVCLLWHGYVGSLSTVGVTITSRAGRGPVRWLVIASGASEEDSNRGKHQKGRMEENQGKDMESPPSLLNREIRKTECEETLQNMQIYQNMNACQWMGHMDHCGPKKGSGLLLRMGKGLATPMCPNESVFLGHSTHMRARRYMPKTDSLKSWCYGALIKHAREDRSEAGKPNTSKSKDKTKLSSWVWISGKNAGTTRETYPRC